MVIFKRLVLTFFIASSFAGFFSPGCWAAPAQILMVRHAEKSPTSDDLSPQGYQRAQAYVNYFETNPAVTRYGTPIAIYAMQREPDGSHARAIETMTPLAKALGLSIHEEFKKNDVQGVVNKILSTPEYDGKMVLICWEHQVLGEIAAQLGVSPAPDYPGDAFNWVWQIDFAHGELSNFTQFRANILPSDGPTSASAGAAISGTAN